MKMRINNPKIYIFNEKGKFIKRKCSVCKIFKEINCFQRSKSRPNNIHPNCKDCRHRYYLIHQQHSKELASNRIHKIRLMAYQVVAGKEIPTCEASKIWRCCLDNTNGLTLSLDHITNDGWLHKREGKMTASASLYSWVIKNPIEAKRKLQVLCMNAQVYKKRVNCIIDFRKNNGFGTLKYGEKTCQACNGKGIVIIDQEGQTDYEELNR